MAPEQWANFAGVDARADIYSLGITLLKLLGVRARKDTQQRSEHVADLLKELRPEVPAKLGRLVQEMVAPQPNDRLGTAGEVATRLRPHCWGAALPRMVEHALSGNSDRVSVVKTPLITRRRLMGASAAAAVLLIPRLVGNRAPQLRRDQWRFLSFASAPVWMSEDDRDAVKLMERTQNELVMKSQELTLVHLGRPVSGAFALQVSLAQKDWLGGAGVFFRGHCRGEGSRRSHSFHTLELRPPNNGEQRLLWSQWIIERDESKRLVDREPLADVAIEVEPDREQTLLVQIGSDGTPTATWNGVQLDRNQWEMSAAAQRLANLRKSKADRFYLGFLGVFSSSEPTKFTNPQLSYLVGTESSR